MQRRWLLGLEALVVAGAAIVGIQAARQRAAARSELGASRELLGRAGAFGAAPLTERLALIDRPPITPRTAASS
jgi:hypothetical protein